MGYTDDNKGDSAIAIATAQILRGAYPDSSLTLISMNWDKRDSLSYHHRFVGGLFDAILPALWPWGPSSSRGWERVRGLSGYAVDCVRSLFLYASTVCGSRAQKVVARISRPSFDALLQADLVVVKGGSPIYRYRGIRGTMFFLRMLFPILLAQRMSKPVVLLGHTLGQVHGFWLQRIYTRMLRESSWIGVRDPISYRFLRELGLPGKSFDEIPDVAFVVRGELTPRVERIAAEIAVLALGGGPIVFVTARSLSFPGAEGGAHSRYVEEVALALNNFADKHHAVILLVPQCIGPVELENDMNTLTVVDRLLSDNVNRYMVVEDLSPPELVELYGMADVGLATRMHSCILGLIGGTPSVLLSYFTSKTEGLCSLEQRGLVTVLSAQSADGAELGRALEELLLGGPQPGVFAEGLLAMSGAVAAGSLRMAEEVQRHRYHATLDQGFRRP